MNKHLLGLALVSALGLAGCGGGDGPADPQIPSTDGVGLSAGAPIIEFETTDSNSDGYLIPLPNDLLFAGTTDLTLNISGVSDADIGGANGTKSIQAQLNKQDGWSATAPFIVKVRSSVGASLDANTLADSVHIFKVTLHRPGAINPDAPISTTNPKVPTGPVTAIESELALGTDFAVGLAAEDTNNRTIRISPLKPLTPQASYMVVITNALKDSNGKTATADVTYAVGKNTTPLPDTASARPLQIMVNAQEAAAAAAGIDASTIAVSYVFTVQSVNEELSAVWAFTNNLFPGVTNPFPYALNFTGAITVPGTMLGLPANLATFRQASLALPYYLTASANVGNTTPVATAGGAMNVDNGVSHDPNGITKNWNAPATINLGGGPIPNPLGTNLSYANPLPSPTGLETIPVLMSLPGPGCTKPDSGWPVTIFQHGITSNRTSMIPLAAALAAPPSCQVTVAIDLPMHGLRASGDYLADTVPDNTTASLAGVFFAGHSTVDSNGALRERLMGIDLLSNTSGAPGTAPDGRVDSSGSWFINLQYLLATRDNLRQGAADLFGLTRALTTANLDIDGVANGTDVDAAKISFAGQSLGSIVGTTFAGVDPKVKVAMLSVPGGGLAKLLDGSMAFGPRIRAGLAGAGTVAGTAAYEQFLWSAQTLVDSGDPINTAARLNARAIPVLVHEVVGTAGLLPSDLVVPNNVIAGTYPNPVTSSPYTIYVTGPLGGTDPLIATLSLTKLSADTSDLEGIRGYVRFTRGAHSSLLANDTTLDPDVGTGAAPVRKEMQQQAVTFIASQGTSVPATEGTGAVEP
ncbi:hypothetical protein HPT27_17200 [Permianibacter sp. IMCC34836]|uniref:hypothetical protein n=1 Tax=Permianibacter fluminis TaxID=2738515 RepID=UPI001552FF8E|nr:hypothetical protein [Permianibacter fluminis]NQD38757.1 hypothetical protein [Permianibacter fluminis]